MFIRKSYYNKVVKRIETLERQSATHARYLHNDFTKLERDFERLKQLEETVGAEQPSIYDSYALANMMARTYLGYDYDEPKIKKITLLTKVNSIMDHLGLVVSTTRAETKIVKKPVKILVKKAVAKKKGKK